MTLQEHQATIDAVAMTTNEYLEALKRLGLGTASLSTAAVLGLSRSQAKRIAAGTCRVPVPVAMLLRLYIERRYLMKQTIALGGEGARP